VHEDLHEEVYMEVSKGVVPPKPGFDTISKSEI